MPLTRKISCAVVCSHFAFIICHDAIAQIPPASSSVATSPGNQQQPGSLSSQLTLDRVIERFLERNLSVEAARYQVDVARAVQIAARIRPNPGLTFSAENVKVSGDTPFNRLYEVSTTYSQTLELGGKRRLRREVADLIVSVAEARLADVLRQRLFEVKHTFYQAALAR